MIQHLKVNSFSCHINSCYGPLMCFLKNRAACRSLALFSSVFGLSALDRIWPRPPQHLCLQTTSRPPQSTLSPPPLLRCLTTAPTLTPCRRLPPSSAVLRSPAPSPSSAAPSRRRRFRALPPRRRHLALSIPRGRFCSPSPLPGCAAKSWTASSF